MEDASDEKKTIREPLLSTTRKGGFRTLPFIIVNEAFEKAASFGLRPNMILYLMREYRMEMAAASKRLFLWSAATNLTPVIGAFIADSYVGRFRMIGFGSIITLLGMILLWLTTMIPQARPSPCNHLINSCESPSTSQLLFLYFSLGLGSIGAGGIRSSSIAFGTDQLVAHGNMQSGFVLESFFNWYYAAASFSVLIALSCIVYVQDHMGWKVGFGVPVVLMFLSVISFFLASSFYVKKEVSASLVTGFAQVVVVSFKNRSLTFSPQDTNTFYHHKKGSTLLVPSMKLRFLNKACIIRNPQLDLTPDGGASNPWSLCTVDQVEELKSVIRVIPLWSAGIFISVNLDQGSVSTVLVASMDRHITSNFEIPAASFAMFMVISFALWIVLYDRVILPLASKIMGKPVRLSLKQKMGLGVFLSCMSMAASAIVESVRRKIAINEGFSDDPQAVVYLSALWLLPHYSLIGVAEAFNTVGQNEIYYSELPKSMSSVALALFGVGMSAASLVASFIISTVDDLTKREGKESWVSSNINKGHYDYYYWLLAGLSLISFLYFIICSRAYGPFEGEDSRALFEDDE